MGRLAMMFAIVRRSAVVPTLGVSAVLAYSLMSAVWFFAAAAPPMAQVALAFEKSEEGNAVAGESGSDPKAAGDNRGKKKKKPSGIPPVIPLDEVVPVAPVTAQPAPSPALTPEEQAKAFRAKFAWSKTTFALPPDFAALPFDPPEPREWSNVGDPPGFGVPREINELAKAPPAPELTTVGTIFAGKDNVTALALSADGSVLAVGTNKGGVSVWDVSTGTKRCDLERTEKGAANSAPVRALALTPDGRHVVVGTAAPHVRVFDAKSGRLAFRHDFFQANVQDVALAHGGTWVFALDGKGRIGGYPLLGGTGIVIDDRIATPKGLYLAAPRKGKSLAFGSNSSKALWTASLFEKTRRDGQPLGTTQPLESVSPTRLEVVAAASDHSALVAPAFNELMLVQHVPSPEGGGRARSMTRRVSVDMPFCHRCALSPDDRYVLALSHSGWVEIRPFDSLPDATVVRLPGGGGKSSAISDDVRTFALDDGNGTITVSRLGPIPEGPRLRFARALGGHLARKDFTRLDRIAERLAKRTAPFEWQPLVEPYDLFLSALPQMTERTTIEEWLEARPESVMARLALVDLNYKAAWERRGSGYAEKVTEEGWKGYKEHMAKAVELLAGLKEGDLPPVVYQRRFLMLDFTGWDPDVVKELEEKLTKDAPGYLPAHGVMAFMNLGRWFGETDADTSAYAARAADAAAKALGDDAGNEIYARIAAQIARYFKREEFFDKTSFDYERVQKGLAALTKRLPDEPLPRNQALRLAWAKQDRDTAALLLKDFDPVIHFRREGWDYTQFKELRDWASK